MPRKARQQNGVGQIARRRSPDHTQTTNSAGLLLQRDELALLDGEHGKGIQAQAAVVGLGEAEDAGSADQPLDLLDG